MFAPSTVRGYHDCIYVGNPVLPPALPSRDTRTDVDKIIDFVANIFRQIGEWAQNIVYFIVNQKRTYSIPAHTPCYRLHYHIQPSKQNDNTPLISVLSNDGGGVRGVV